MPSSHRVSRGNARLLACFLGVVMVMAIAAPAPAAPRRPRVGPTIDRPAFYDGQKRCAPKPKPGVVAFRDAVLSAYPWTVSGGIGRACHIGGQSEHKEGRAWDWMVSASSARDRAAVDDLVEWLLTEDRFRNEIALARRTGIMYLIWNRTSWSPYGGWRTYCVQKRRGCVSPVDGKLRNPHTDHVHFSFSWQGARKRTTFWRTERSMVTDLAQPAASSGFWLVGGNGGVVARGGAMHLGDLDVVYPRPPVASIAALGDGSGYWEVTSRGRVTAFGAAPDLGHGSTDRIAVDIEGTPSGGGYWITSSTGKVTAFGDAPHLGEVTKDHLRVADMEATPSGLGYWLVLRGGRVLAFGDAPALGGLTGTGENIAGIASSASGKGYWIATSGGRVGPFGDALPAGDLRDKTLAYPVVALEALPGGTGYRMVTAVGRVFSFSVTP